MHVCTYTIQHISIILPLNSVMPTFLAEHTVRHLQQDNVLLINYVTQFSYVCAADSPYLWQLIINEE